MSNETEKIFDAILNRMDDETKNILIKALMTHDKEDISIQTIPVYQDVCHEGHLIMRFIKEMKYVVSVKHDADTLTLTGDESHIVWLNEKDKVEDIIDSEIERIADEYMKMGTTYKMWSDGGYGDLLRADGALKELQELKRKIKEG